MYDLKPNSLIEATNTLKIALLHTDRCVALSAVLGPASPALTRDLAP